MSTSAAVTLVVGSEEFLAERAVGRLVRAARDRDPDTDVRDLAASDLTAATLAELLSPSLFGERRVVLVRGLGTGRASDADDDDTDDTDAPSGGIDAAALDLLLQHAAEPEPDAQVVLLHREANRGRAQLNALRKAGAAEVACKAPTGRALTDFVTEELRATGRKVSADAAQAVIGAVGKNLRELASACAQLAGDLPNTAAIDRAAVDRFFAGRVEADAFAVADLVVEGRTPAALTMTRHAMSVGVSGPAITAACAYSFRNLVTAAAAPRGVSLEDAARDVGMRDWQLRKARNQLSGWRPEGVSIALRAIADADAEVKGAAVDADYAIEKMVIAIGRARARQ